MSLYRCEYCEQIKDSDYEICHIVDGELCCDGCHEKLTEPDIDSQLDVYYEIGHD